MTAPTISSANKKSKVLWLVLVGTALLITGLAWNAKASMERSRAEVSVESSSGSTWSDIGGFGDRGAASEEANSHLHSQKTQQVVSGLLALAGLGLLVSGIVVHRRNGKASAAGVAQSEGPATPTGHEARQPCLRCGESIPTVARMCRFCGVSLTT